MLLFENLKKVNREKNTPKKKTTEKPLQVARPTNEENKQINSPVAPKSVQLQVNANSLSTTLRG